MAKTFYVDFSGYCEIQADTYYEAEEKFWEYIDKGEPLPSNIYEVDGTEEKVEVE